MIEFPITLTSGGSVCMPGYVFALALGYTKNRGVYRLAVTASGEWEGLTIRCFWHVPDGKDPSSSLVVDGYVAVPASVTAQPGSGCITFEGSDGAKVMTSADLRYRVSANSGTEDGTEPEPGTPAWQQLVDAVHTDATAAEQAKTDAQTAAQQAGASAQKAGNALSDTITAKEDALKATKDAQTAASEAVTSAGSASQSAQEAAGSLQELKNGIANGDFKGEKGDTGPAVALDTTLTHEGEAADAKATGDAISAVKARQNVLVGTETGNPIAVDDAFPAPLCGLTVYGLSTQDGTPTPDAPVPIVSAGDSGSVAVKVRGKNLWDNFKTLSLGNVEQKKGTYIATTSTMQVDITPASVGARPLRLKAGNTYTFSLKTTVSISSYKFVCLKYTNGEGKNIIFANIDFVNFVPERDVENVGFVLYETVAGDKVYDVQLEMGSKATSYEPYREQLLTLPTPTGLPGIPVTSGGNYTDSTGQQWVCDEINLERGVRVQRIASFVINAKNANDIFVTNEYTNVTVAVNARLNTQQKTNRDVRSERCVFCEALPWSANTWASTVNCAGFVENDSVDLTIENSYLGTTEASTYDERKTALVKYFTDNPCRVVYRIATPIETPLTPDEIAVYKALTVYGPDMVVQAGDGAGIKLDYQRDVNLVVKNLEDAIASMTTT